MPKKAFPQFAREAYAKNPTTPAQIAILVTPLHKNRNPVPHSQAWSRSQQRSRVYAKLSRNPTIESCAKKRKSYTCEKEQKKKAGNASQQKLRSLKHAYDWDFRSRSSQTFG